MSMIVTLPSKVKVDVNQAFDLVEDNWGSNGLMALVVYGSAMKNSHEKIPYDWSFLFWGGVRYKEVRVEPNDIDIAAIYSNPIDVRDVNCEGNCRIMEQHEDVDNYSIYWADSTRCANMHAMCISYDTLVARKNEDANLRKVFEEGAILWGDLPRPMRRLIK